MKQKKIETHKPWQGSLSFIDRVDAIAPVQISQLVRCGMDDLSGEYLTANRSCHFVSYLPKEARRSPSRDLRTNLTTASSRPLPAARNFNQQQRELYENE
jgi:hypothetical protein